MLRFPIECELRYVDVSFPQSFLKLNNEWTLKFLWKTVDVRYKLDFIEIHREKNCDETAIFGTLSVSQNCEKRGSFRFGSLSVQQNCEQKTSTQAFSKLIESGIAFTKLIDMHTDITIYQEYGIADNASLHGVVNVISIGETCSNDFPSRSTKIYLQPKSLVHLSEDFERLLDPQTSCNPDVNLKCGSDSIMAHKLILSARSPVFSAMFKNPMKESHKNEVEITDVEATVLRAMINYIYTGKTSGLTVSSASDLLFAADKYQLPDLKRVCCDFLKESISLQIVMRIIVLGDLYAEDLKYFCMDYICKNYKNFSDFEDIEEWKTLKEDRPALAVDILSSVLKSKDKIK